MGRKFPMAPTPSEFQGDDFQQFGGIHHPCRHAISLREVSFVPGYQEVSFSRYSAGDELIIIRIRRNVGYRTWIHRLTSPAEQVEQSIDLIARKRKPGSKKHFRIFVEDLVGETRHDEPLVHCHDEQSFIAFRRDHGRHQNIRVDDRANHLRFSRR